MLADVTPRQLLGLAGPMLPESYRRGLQDFQPAAGAFKIDYALSEPIPWRAAECRRAATVHLGGTLEEIEASEATFASDRPFCLLVQPSLFDPSRAPTGKHTAWVYCQSAERLSGRPHGHDRAAAGTVCARVQRVRAGAQGVGTGSVRGMEPQPRGRRCVRRGHGPEAACVPADSFALPGWTSWALSVWVIDTAWGGGAWHGRNARRAGGSGRSPPAQLTTKSRRDHDGQRERRLSPTTSVNSAGRRSSLRDECGTRCEVTGCAGNQLPPSAFVAVFSSSTSLSRAAAVRRDLGVNNRPLFLLDRLTHGGKCFYAVAGVEAGRVDHVLKPWAIGQAGWIKEGTFRLHQGGVDGRAGGRCGVCAEGLLKVGGCGGQVVRGLVEWGEVKVRRG